MNRSQVHAVVLRTLNALDERINDLQVTLHRENQGDVYRDSLGQSLGDSRQGSIGRRNLNHRVLLADALPELTGLRNRGLVVVGVARIDLDGNTAIDTVGFFGYTSEKVTGIADVVDCHREHSICRVRTLCSELRQLRVVILTGGHRRREDCRVSSDTDNPKLFNKIFQIARGEALARKIVEPRRSPYLGERFHRGVSHSV